MGITAKLKELILSRYKNLHVFAEELGIAYTTLDSMLKKDLSKAGWGTIKKICGHLEISADALGEGRIVSNKQLHLSPDEVEMIEEFRVLDVKVQRLIRRLVKAEYEDETAEAEAAFKNESDVTKNQNKTCEN